MERRAEQFEDHRIGCLGHRYHGARQTALADPALAAQDHAGLGQSTRSGLCPKGLQSSEFLLTADQGTADVSARLVFTGDPVVDDLPLDAFDSLGRAGLEVELVAYHPFDRHRRRDLAGVGQAADAGGEIGAQSVDVVLGDVEVDQFAVDADTDVDIETEAVVHPRTEVGDFADDVQAGQHSTMGIVFVCLRMPEDSHHAAPLVEPMWPS